MVDRKNNERSYKIMTLKEFARDNPKRKFILLWFGKDEELKTDYCYANNLSKTAKKMLNWEVMETSTFDEEDWIEVWLKNEV